MVYLTGITNLKKDATFVLREDRLVRTRGSRGPVTNVPKQPTVPRGQRLFVFYYNDGKHSYNKPSEEAVDVTEPKTYARVMHYLTATVKTYPELYLIKNADVQRARKQAEIHIPF